MLLFRLGLLQRKVLTSKGTIKKGKVCIQAHKENKKNSLVTGAVKLLHA